MVVVVCLLVLVSTIYIYFFYLVLVSTNIYEHVQLWFYSVKVIKHIHVKINHSLREFGK